MPFSPLVLENVKKTGRGYDETMELGGYTFLVYYQPLSYENNVVGVLQISRMVNDIEQFLQNLQYILLIAGVLMIALAASVGWFLARKTLQPIETVIEAAQQIQNSDDLNKKIAYDGPADEIGRLTDTINSMFTRIQQSYSDLQDSIQAQKRFVADASHELRTPLTTIRGNIDWLRKIQAEKQELEPFTEVFQDISEEAERMSRLLNDMLMLARSDAGFKMEREPLLMVEIVREVARKAQLLPKTVEWQVADLSTLDGVFVNGNKDYLQQLLYIFIENAFKYTHEGYVRLEGLKSNEQIGIKIIDTGIGLDREQIPYIFERFYRADPSRGLTSGTGLGLSIARWIIDEHQGSIEVTTHKGEGTTFIIWLPVHLVSLH
jgi:two-component system OmpR family sensor kinase